MSAVSLAIYGGIGRLRLAPGPPGSPILRLAADELAAGHLLGAFFRSGSRVRSDSLMLLAPRLPFAPLLLAATTGLVGPDRLLNAASTHRDFCPKVARPVPRLRQRRPTRIFE